MGEKRRAIAIDPLSEESRPAIPQLGHPAVASRTRKSHGERVGGRRGEPLGKPRVRIVAGKEGCLSFQLALCGAAGLARVRRACRFG